MDNKKVKPYTRNAIKKYQSKYDNITVSLPRGTKDTIKQLTGLSVNKYINNLVKADLERLTREDHNAYDPKKNSRAPETINPADIFFNYEE